MTPASACSAGVSTGGASRVAERVGREDPLEHLAAQGERVGRPRTRHRERDLLADAPQRRRRLNLNASLVVAALKNLNGRPLARVLSAKGEAVPAAPLSATFNATRGSRPLPVPANAKLPTLFLIGDSTVRNGQGDGNNGQWGWGEPLVALFDTAKLNVVNRAVGGLSSRTYLTLGHWEKALALMKPGDFVIIQFGHNDRGALNDEPPPPLRARGTIKGTGDEAVEIDNVMTKKHEVVHTYGWYLRKMIADTQAKGATPILLSLTLRNIWKDGRIERTSRYSKWTAELAASSGVAFFDLSTAVADQFEKLGAENTAALAQHPVVSRDAWLAARKELLVREKDLTHQYDRLCADRRKLP